MTHVGSAVKHQGLPILLQDLLLYYRRDVLIALFQHLMLIDLRSDCAPVHRRLAREHPQTLSPGERLVDSAYQLKQLRLKVGAAASNGVVAPESSCIRNRQIFARDIAVEGRLQ